MDGRAVTLNLSAYKVSACVAFMHSSHETSRSARVPGCKAYTGIIRVYNQ